MVERKLPSQFLTSHRRSHARAERPSGILAARSLRPRRRWFRVFQMALAGLLVAIATNTPRMQHVKLRPMPTAAASSD